MEEVQLSSNEKESVTKKVAGKVEKKKVYIDELESAQPLIERGYGTKLKGRLALSPCEALYLISDEWLEVWMRQPKRKLDFEELLSIYSNNDASVWSKYLVYRDLRERGYVVKTGFGEGADFRVYERGTYGRSAARIIISIVREGELLTIGNLMKVLGNALNLKKSIILAVIERRGEIVYYSLSQFNL
jgi:tRNA-intron endonuclease